MRREWEERCIRGGSHLGESDRRRLRPSGSVVSAVNWPDVGSEIPEDPLSEDVVSGGGEVSLGGLEVLFVSSVVTMVVSLVVLSVVSVFVELSGGVKALVSVILEDGDKSVELSGGVKALVSVILEDGDKSVEFDSVVESVWSVQL